jgi:predicted transcriptional regulator
MTAGLVGKCIENGVLKPGEVPGFIATTYAAFASAVAGPVIAGPEPEAWSPQVAAFAIEQSVTDDYIICLEDGRRFKSMRGHLRKLDMSP